MTSFIPVLLAKLTLILSFGLIVGATLRSLSPSHRHLILVDTRERSGIAGSDGVVAAVERSCAATLFLAGALADERSGCVECK